MTESFADTQIETILAHAGREPDKHGGIVNPPVYRMSTVLHPTLDALKNSHERRYQQKTTYGAHGSPTAFALADVITALEKGNGTVLSASGLGAITLALCTFVKNGDHILVADSAYGPTRLFCDSVLKRFGVTTTYYEPTSIEAVAAQITPQTRIIFAETPGSFTFEMQDIPALAELAHANNALLLVDNTWGTPLFFNPISHGADVSIQAVTKYLSGHSDLVLGSVTTATETLFRQVKDCAIAFGDVASPDDCYLALRGVRSMSARLARHQESGLQIAKWLHQHPKVSKVLHPALPHDPGYALWKRDFTGCCSLFSIVLHCEDEQAIARFIEQLKWFKLGASWGGYESLIYVSAGLQRTALPRQEKGMLVRLHVGLEHVDDLKKDLAQALVLLPAP